MERGRPHARGPILLLALSGCSGSKDDETAEPPWDTSETAALERNNGVDDDGDGEVDEPILTSEADHTWGDVYHATGIFPPSHAVLPDLVPLDNGALGLVRRGDLLRDRSVAERVAVFSDAQGDPGGAFGYTADLDGDGFAEVFAGFVDEWYDHTGPESSNAWSTAGLLPDTPLGEPDFACDSGETYTERFWGMYAVGPLSGSEPLVVCAYEDLDTSELVVPLYPVSAFTDGFALPEEATRSFHLPEGGIHSRAADLDGDGVPDFLLDVSDETLLFPGATFTPGEWTTADAALAWSIPNATLEPTGDITGDGVADLLALERNGPQDDTSGDRAYLLDPTSGGGEVASLAISVVQLGIESRGGVALAVGDGDMDARDEVILAWQNLGGSYGPGVVYLFDGATLASPGVYGPAHVAMTFGSGEPKTDIFGEEISTWDLDGNGFMELILSEVGGAAVFMDVAAR